MELTTIRTDTRYLVSPQLTSTDYPDADLDRNMNRWYRTILGWIIPVQGDWELAGDILTNDCQVGVTDYAVPQLVRVYKGEIMYETGGQFVPLTFISVQRDQRNVEGNATRIMDDVTRPTAELFGNYLQIRPAPSEAVTNGIKLWAQTDVVDIDITYDVPDLIESVQRILSYGAAYDYCLSQEMYSKAKELKKNIFGDASMPDDTGLKGIIEDLYANRSGARRDRIVARKRTRFI